MTDKDTKEMIERCIEEITRLQGEVTALRPRAAAYDTITQILGLLPRTSQGYGVDIVWQLKKELAGLQPKPAVTEPADDIQLMPAKAKNPSKYDD